jgi:phosphonoacetaldehyde hydrolase
MCLRNAEKLGIYPMEACVKIGDTIPDVEEGLNAGMWTIGLAKSGNELGMNEREIAALPADRLQAGLERAYRRMAAAGTAIFRVPPELSDFVACPANCATATVAAAV